MLSDDCVNITLSNVLHIFPVLDLEMFQMDEVNFKVTQGHWYLRHYIGYIISY